MSEEFLIGYRSEHPSVHFQPFQMTKFPPLKFSNIKSLQTYPNTDYKKTDPPLRFTRYTLPIIDRLCHRIRPGNFQSGLGKCNDRSTQPPSLLSHLSHTIFTNDRLTLTREANRDTRMYWHTPRISRRRTGCIDRRFGNITRRWAGRRDKGYKLQRLPR